MSVGPVFIAHHGQHTGLVAIQHTTCHSTLHSTTNPIPILLRDEAEDGTWGPSAVAAPTRSKGKSFSLFPSHLRLTDQFLIGPEVYMFFSLPPRNDHWIHECGMRKRECRGVEKRLPF